MKRIFTKRFSGAIDANPPGLVFEDQNALETWLVQEDIDVIGAEVAVASHAPSENDGYALVSVELSQVGVMNQDGSILLASSTEGWNTAPPGICQASGHAMVTFPNGMAVPVKEEGYLYINGRSKGKSAGPSLFSYGVVVYYTKKGAR
ncbi:hypothetical protein ES703_121807 [subsurface metagenome]